MANLVIPILEDLLVKKKDELRNAQLKLASLKTQVDHQKIIQSQLAEEVNDIEKTLVKIVPTSP